VVPRRLHALRDTAFTDPQSPFRQLTQVSAAEVDAFGTQVWKTINEVNLIENIQPTRARATLVLHKGADHRSDRSPAPAILSRGAELTGTRGAWR
jgi:type I pantothenate kinase